MNFFKSNKYSLTGSKSKGKKDKKKASNIVATSSTENYTVKSSAPRENKDTNGDAKTKKAPAPAAPVPVEDSSQHKVEEQFRPEVEDVKQNEADVGKEDTKTTENSEDQKEVEDSSKEIVDGSNEAENDLPKAPAPPPVEDEENGECVAENKHDANERFPSPPAEALEEDESIERDAIKQDLTKNVAAKSEAVENEQT